MLFHSQNVGHLLAISFFHLHNKNHAPEDCVTGCVLSAAWCRKCGEGRLSWQHQPRPSGQDVGYLHHLDLVLHCTVLYSGQDGGYPHHLDLDTIIFIWSYGRASTSAFRPPTSAAPPGDLEYYCLQFLEKMLLKYSLSSLKWEMFSVFPSGQ